MLSWVSRTVLGPRTYIRKLDNAIQLSTKVLSPAPSFSRRGVEQVDFIKSAVEERKLDWPSIKSQVLSIQGQINEKNYEGVLLKFLTSGKHLEAGLSYATHLKTSSKELTLGSINGLLGLYAEIGKTRSLTDEEKTFIIDTHKSLYDKYKVLDYATCEKLIKALCAVNEYEKALKVLENILLSSVPSHVAYSTIIGTLFKNNKKKKAVELITNSVENKRPLQYPAYSEWINYIFRKYKDKKVIMKYLDEIYAHIARNYAVIDDSTAKQLKESFESLGFNAGFSRIRKTDGQCIRCKDTLDLLELTNKEFNLLQQNIKEKLIVGSDLFLKTSPEEFKRFTDFVEKTAPYDVVIDCLNVAYTVGRGSPKDRVHTLNMVVDYFQGRNKKILLLGRKHMLNWGKGIEKLMRNTCSFFTDNLSEDDPYFITAAILSGPNTDIVSKDLLRGHKFLLQDEQLRYIFRRWQWQHQWMVYATYKGTKIQAPLQFTPCAQKKDGAWHLPYEREEIKEKGQFNDGTPDLSSWLCITTRNKIDMNKILQD